MPFYSPNYLIVKYLLNTITVDTTSAAALAIAMA